MNFYQSNNPRRIPYRPIKAYYQSLNNRQRTLNAPYRSLLLVHGCLTIFTGLQKPLTTSIQSHDDPAKAFNDSLQLSRIFIDTLTIFTTLQRPLTTSIQSHYNLQQSLSIPKRPLTDLKRPSATFKSP